VLPGEVAQRIRAVSWAELIGIFNRFGRVAAAHRYLTIDQMGIPPEWCAHSYRFQPTSGHQMVDEEGWDVAATHQQATFQIPLKRVSG
jgi:hypothetical protein